MSRLMSVSLTEQAVVERRKTVTRRKGWTFLKPGDEIITTGGLIGEVKDVITPVDGPTELILELAPGVRVRAVTEAVSRRLTTLAAVEDSPKPTPEEVSQPSA